MTPQSLRRNGVTADEDHQAAKQSMDEIHRHVLKVKELRDAFRRASDASATAPALSNDYGGYAGGGYGGD